jgi:hypothetical protein
MQSRHDLVARVLALTGVAPDEVEVSATWKDNRGWDAGVIANAEGISVFYGSAQTIAADPGEAARILRAIFTDEIVCVTALEDDMPVHDALARYDDPSASFTSLDRPSARGDMPAIDDVLIRSWTGARDKE